MTPIIGSTVEYSGAAADTVKPSGETTVPHHSETSATPARAPQGASVHLSEKARAMQALARGANRGMTADRISAWARHIASGQYQPPSRSVAEALVRFEASLPAGR